MTGLKDGQLKKIIEITGGFILMPTPINLSASRGAAILGLSKWSTPVQVWLNIMESREPGFCKKHNYEIPVFDQDAANLRWGHAFESAIIALAESIRSMKIWDRETLYTNTELKYITCHIDGAYFEHEIGILHEGKTTSIHYFRDNFGDPGTDQVPIEYQIQCQHGMICTGADKVILSVLVFPKRVEEFEEIGLEIHQDSDGYYIHNNLNNVLDICPIDWAHTLDQMGYFHQYEINANQELQQLMIKHYSDFWNNHVLIGIPPAPKTYDDIKALVREPIGTIIANPEIERLAYEYKQIKSEISNTGTLGKRAEQIKVELLKYMSESGMTIDDDSQDKFILRDQSGRKLVSYGKNKNGGFIFR